MLNGFIADQANSLDWLFSVMSDEQPPVATNAAVRVEGSTTYERVLEHEDLIAQPQKWAEYFGNKPTFVFTTRDLPVPEGADVRFVRGDVTDALPAIREAASDRDIWIVGGGDLAVQFMDAGVLDEISVSIVPATVGVVRHCSRGRSAQIGCACDRQQQLGSSLTWFTKYFLLPGRSSTFTSTLGYSLAFVVVVGARPDRDTPRLPR